jgi:hypothetical protein
MPFCVTFEFLKAVTVKNTAFWYVMPCTPVEIYQSLGETSSDFVALCHAEDRNSRFLRNVGKFKHTTRRHKPADSILK